MYREKLPISIRVTVKSHSKNLLDALFGIIKVPEVGIELELDLFCAHNVITDYKRSQGTTQDSSSEIING